MGRVKLRRRSGVLLPVRWTLVAVVGLLLFSLATIELPKLVDLIDNTSNDYSLVLFAKDAPRVIRVRVGMLPHGSRGPADTQRRPTAGSCSADLFIQPIHTPDNMLHLLCVQRT